MSDTAGPCELCGRFVPERTKHHLIPRRTHRQTRIRKKFARDELHRRTAMLCRPCHKTVHATLSEAELAEVYNTVEALRDHPEIERFVRWVRKQPVDRRIGVRSTAARREQKRGRR